MVILQTVAGFSILQIDVAWPAYKSDILGINTLVVILQTVAGFSILQIDVAWPAYKSDILGINTIVVLLVLIKNLLLFPVFFPHKLDYKYLKK